MPLSYAKRNPAGHTKRQAEEITVNSDYGYTDPNDHGRCLAISEGSVGHPHQAAHWAGFAPDVCFFEARTVQSGDGFFPV